MTTNNFIELKKVKFFEVKGNDRVQFLQSIITNDINKCRIDHVIYSALLSPQGKFISDFFITNLDKSFLFEINKDFYENTVNKLLMYKLRAEIQIKETEGFKSIAIYKFKNLFNSLTTSGEIKKIKNSFVYLDPRNSKMGLKGTIKKNEFQNFCKNYKLTKGKILEYNENRIKNLIPDSNTDLKLNKSLLLENNFQSINCIDWDKGCYIGQELTARMKYRSLIKKSLTKILILSENTRINDNIFLKNKNIGIITSISNKFGLAMIKIEDAKYAFSNNSILKTDNGKIKINLIS